MSCPRLDTVFAISCEILYFFYHSDIFIIKFIVSREYNREYIFDSFSHL